MTATLLGLDRQHWQGVAEGWANEFPDIHSLATEEAARIIKQFTGRELAPEKIWWHRFDRAVSSPRSFTGWQHVGRPIQSLGFVELLLERYSANDQDSLDNLQVEGGFYTDDAGHGVYDERNEVRLLATEVAAAFWKLDFAQLYKTRLGRFWHRQGEHFVSLARIALRAAIVTARQRQALTPVDLKRLQSLYDGQPLVGVYTLTLGPYSARDILRMASADGRQILYLPGDPQAIRVFATAQGLYQWLRETIADPAGQQRLLEHFSAFNLRHAQQQDGLQQLLAQVRDDTGGAQVALLELKGPAIAGDPLLWMRKAAQREMLLQAETLLTSNAHLRQQLWLGYLGTFVNLGSAFVPLGWPIALLVVGASAISFVLNVRKAVRATTAAERRDGIKGAILSAVTVAFTAPLLFDISPASEVGGSESASVLPELRIEDVDTGVILPGAPMTPVGARLNTLGLLERSDLPTLYRIDPLPRGATSGSVLQPLHPTTDFTLAKAMLDEPLLRVFGSQGGALEYAKSEFDGPFVLHEIDSHGLRAASFRENLLHNQAALLAHLEQPTELLQNLHGAVLDELANGAWACDEVHLAMDGLDPGDFLPVSVKELSAVPAGSTDLQPPLDGADLMRGVRTRSPGFGRSMPHYSIDIENVSRGVRYDPLTDTWRSDQGGAWRYEGDRKQFEPVTLASTSEHRSSAAIDRAVQAFGIDAQWPWQVESFDASGAMPLPRKIHSVWLGKRMPGKFVKRVIHNAEEAGQGANPFETHLYLDIKDPVDLDKTLLRLAKGPATLKVHRLEASPFFAALRDTPYYAQYVAASSGPALNYASAVDVLRYRLLASEGGLYMDVDDLIEGSGDGVANFAEHEFVVKPGHLLLNNLVFHRRLNMLMDFNTSNFASLPGNPLLDLISEESYQRYLADPTLYAERPFDFHNGDAEMDAYGRRISYTTGPRLFNDVLARELPAYRQFRALHRIARGELYVAPLHRAAIARQLSDCWEQYCRLGGLIRIGSTGSWLYT